MKMIVTIFLASVFGIALLASTAFAGYGGSSSSEKSNKRLSGYVKEYKTLIPLSKAKVKLYKTNGKLQKTKSTDKKGKFKFSDLKRGTYKIKTSFVGYRNPKDAKKNTVSARVKVKGSNTKNLYLQKI